MLAFSTCAELESVMNEAAIDAAHARRNEITMPDIISAVLHNDYNHPDNLNQKSKEELYKIEKEKKIAARGKRKKATVSE